MAEVRGRSRSRRDDNQGSRPPTFHVELEELNAWAARLAATIRRDFEEKWI